MTSFTHDRLRREACITLAVAALGLAGCGGGGGGNDGAGSTPGTGQPPPGPGPAPAPQSLTLLAADPADRSGQVARDVQPSLEFSAALDAATVTPANATFVEAGGAAVSAAATTSGASVRISPASLLWPDTEYRFTVDGVRGSLGQELAAPVTTRFATRDGQWRADAVTAMRNVSSFDGESHRLAVAPDGSALAIWRLPDGANLNRLWASRRGTDGRWGAPAEVGTSVPGDFGYPSLAMTPDGTAHVAWSSAMGIGGRQQVFASQLGAADTTWSAPVQLSDDAVITHVEPMLGAGAGGDVYATWVGGGSAPYDILLARRLPDGRWSAPVIVNEANGRGVYGPTLAVSDDGRAMLVWAEQIGNDHALKWRAYRRDVSAPEPLAPAAGIGGPTGPLGRFSLAMNAAGEGVLAWLVFDGSTRTIWAAIKGIIVAEWSTPQTLDGEATEDRAPIVAVDETGDAVVVWEGTAPGGSGRVFARRYERGSGQRSTFGWSALRELSDGAGGGVPAVASDARGNALVLWQSDNSGVRASRFTRRQGWQPAATVTTLGAPGSIFEPRVAFDGTGSAVAIWVESDMVFRTAAPSYGFAVGGARFD